AGDDYLSMKYVDAVDMFHDMEALAAILRRKREKRGAIDFDVDEAKVIVNENGKPIDIVARERGISEHIIEEFMLCANETVAEHFKWLELPMIYRVHETPEVKKLRQFVAIARPLGYTIHGSLNPVNPNELAKIVTQSAGRPEHKIITTLLLRSMQKARYDAQCLGHFGLADDYYTHFTSPIRRYPDLLVHRMIRTFLFEQNYERVDDYEKQMPEWAEHCSLRERVAVDTEYEVEDMKKAEYMMDHIGETYMGVVSSVTSFGFFVELPNTIEGLVHISTLLDDHYIYDERNMMLIGTRSGRKIRMADEIKVTVTSASKLEKTIDFECAGFSKKKRRIANTQRKRRRR
ncbi:MAG: RNB domain-containing ribonuclease, partial [Erysipelotrichaceae bacterium]|nr:RNB domain-containing ribonuclease [Erysipelotrichaceae bacterium]